MSRGQKKQRNAEGRGKNAGQETQSQRQSADPFYDHELPVEAIGAISAISPDSEVEQYIAQEDLTPADRAIYLLEHGSNLQKCSVVEGLQRLHLLCTGNEMECVLNAMGELLWKFDDDVQSAAADGMLEALPDLTPLHLKHMFPLLKTMTCLRAENVREKWRAVALSYITYFPSNEMQDEALQFAFELSDPSEPADLRKLCCEIIGAVFPRLSSHYKEGPFLQKVLVFCQDTDYNVRISMCGQLTAIAHAVGLHITKTFITKELFELLEDEEKAVVHAAFNALVDMIDFFDEQFRRERILPMIKSYLVRPSDEESSMLLSCFGKFMWELAGDVKAEEDIQLFCNFFNSKAQHSDMCPLSIHWRSLCAYNFPAVVRSVGTKKFFSYLVQTYKALCEDYSVDIRRRMAAGFHEVCLLLKEKSLPHLREPFFALAQDNDMDVQDAIFANLGVILQSFNYALNEDKQIFHDCLGPICAYEAAVRPYWRKVSHFLEQMDQFPCYFTGDMVYEKFIPILFRHLAQSTVEVKDKCAGLIMAFTRKLHNSTQQVEIISRVLNDFGHSRSYWHRQTFVICSIHCLEHFSRKFFREKMVETILDLARDPVANVRRRLCIILPYIKKVLRPPAPVDLLASFNERVARLAMDIDKDVSESARKALLQMDEMEQELVRRQELGLDDEEEDRIDSQREEEENVLLEAAHEIEKQQRRKALRELIAEGEKTLPNAPNTPQGVISLAAYAHGKPDAPSARRPKKPSTIPIRVPPTNTIPPRSAPVILSKLIAKPSPLPVICITADYPRLPSAGQEPRKTNSPGHRKESSGGVPSMLPTLTTNGRVGLTAKRK